MLSFPSRKQRLLLTISISLVFFVAEISVGFYTRSLAVIADGFHYLNDLVGFIIALVALVVSDRKTSPPSLSFGWQRSQLLGAFFNGVFLLALGVGIFVQAIERFVSVQQVENPELVLIIGGVGLVLNVISAAFLHEHDHGTPQSQVPEIEKNSQGSTTHTSPQTVSAHAKHHHHTRPPPKRSGHDLGLMGVLVHVLGDAINNVGVIIAALVMWLTASPVRFYADPAVSIGIAIMILSSSIPLVKNSGKILLQGAPRDLDLKDVKHDLEQVPGVASIHELHIWQLSQQKSVASAHVVLESTNSTIAQFMECARTITECLHSYGVHSATLQPEFAPANNSGGDHLTNGGSNTGDDNDALPTSTPPALRRRIVTGDLASEESTACQITCGNVCGDLACCT